MAFKPCIVNTFIVFTVQGVNFFLEIRPNSIVKGRLVHSKIALDIYGRELSPWPRSLGGTVSFPALVR